MAAHVTSSHLAGARLGLAAQKKSPAGASALYSASTADVSSLQSRATRLVSRASKPARKLTTRAVGGTVASSTAENVGEWVPVIPMEALPKGDRRVIRQGGLTILLLWYRNEIYAIESTSPAEGAYSEGFVNAKLTQDGSIVCPTTDSTYDLKTGAVREWYPNNPVLRFLTPSLRDMRTFPVKIEDGQILIGLKDPAVAAASTDAAEIVFRGKVRVGQTADDVTVSETRMVVDENEGGFGFTVKNELVNGRAAMIGFVALLMIEAATGKGLLATTGFLDFLYRNGIPEHLLG